ncbi:MAG: TlpA disulfide reductase family protein [Bacteroidota bacterium]|nr:TlpA disulfide reductase family protein [Bacteroidota bacterium]
MNNTTNRLKENWQKKNLFGKITDILIILFIVSLFIPQSRMVVGGFINRVKAMIIAPSKEAKENIISLTDSDYNWLLTDMNGKEVSLKDSQGKVIFVNLWATWCPPCVGEMPELQELWDKFETNENFALYLITNEDHATVQSFLDKREYNFPIYISKYKSPEPFQSRSIPTSYIISKTGKIIVKETGAANWGGKKTEKLIRNLMAE